MAFRKYANAALVKSGIDFDAWADLKRIGEQDNTFTERTAAKVVLQEFDPKQYLLSHVTIMASVDTEESNQPIGRHIVDGVEIDRRYSDYYITPKTSAFVNNNFDSWERRLLLSTYKTFIGAQNYLEHIQLPELSKGRIIDAAARDTGDSVYIDILVATDRKHKPLIESITSGQLQTLSMGCFLPGTQVSLGDGTRVAIEDVQVGDLVLTHRGRRREVQNKQVRFGQWGLRKIRAVGVPNEIVSTDNHPFFVLRPASHCACGCGEPLETRRHRDPARRLNVRFKPGHVKRILNHKGPCSVEKYNELANIKAHRLEEVRADELQPGDYLCFPKVKSASDFKDVTEGKARLLGYFLAEGSFLKRTNEPVEVQFNFNLNEEHTFVQEVVELLQREFPAANTPWVQKRSDRNTATVHMTGRQAVLWFKEHGGEYSHRKKLSPEVMDWPSQYHMALLGAWLNGDGTNRSSGGQSLSGTTTSYDMACQLHCLAQSNGVFARLECKYGNVSTDISQVVNTGFAAHPVTGKKPSFNLVFGKYFSSKLSEHTTKAFQGSKKQNFRDFGDVVIFPITSIEPAAYEGWVHDMEVEEDHSYVVEGVAVHNCTVSATQCTKCGNVAEDETQLCTHIKYMKGNTFFDAAGVQRKVAELCGHRTDPKSVSFLEASWVANPAFTGAVVRNILSPEDVALAGQRIQVAFTQPARYIDPNLAQKAAHTQVRAQDEFTGLDGQATPPAADATPAEADPLSDAVDSVADQIRDKALEKVRGDLGKEDMTVLPSENRNDTIIKEALKHPQWRRIAHVLLGQVKDPKIARRLLLGMAVYRSGGWAAVQASKALSGRDILALARLSEMSIRKAARAGTNRIYKTILAVGGINQYADQRTFLAACRREIGREITGSEQTDLLVKGYLYSLGC